MTSRAYARPRAAVMGRGLMCIMAEELVDRGRGRTGAALWLLRGNDPARTFYERLGGVLVGERPDATPAEVAYGWIDLSALTR